MIRRNRHYNGLPNRNCNPVYPPSETNQREPSLRELLVKYQRGEDISDFVSLPAEKATAEQQFKNRFAKVDPLTEIEQYVKKEVNKANEMVETEHRTRSKKLNENLTPPPSDPTNDDK